MKNRRTWEQIEKQLDDRINNIFIGIDINELSNYEKRKIIFEYVCKHGNYDFDLLENIRIKGPRNPWNELYAAIDEQLSICNGFSQYYKLLLEKVGIYSLCICCNDGTDVPHQLSIVSNDDGTFSFDDTTSVIVGKGSIDDFFDYDIEFASKLNQGNNPIYKNENNIFYWCTLPTKMLDALVCRPKSEFDEYNEKSGFGLFEEIKSQKKQISKNI